MPRRARLVFSNVPMHVIQRGNNRQTIFYQPTDYHRYLNWLHRYAKASGCVIHAYVLMTNHVHLLLTPDSCAGPSLLMKQLGQHYVQYFNRTYERSGTLLQGRYKSCLIDTTQYLLECYRYIEMNPVRAGMVDHPAKYFWSSYNHNAQGELNPIVQPHGSFESLGSDSCTRRYNYRELFTHHLKPELVDEIRLATNGNYVLGDSLFKEQIATQLSCRVTRGKPGRPCKSAG